MEMNHILIVEDDKDIREGVGIYLKSQGYQVFMAADGVEGLEVLEQEESDSENDEMIEIINSTVGKLQQIEDKYYYSLDLNYYLNNLEDDAYEA